MTTEKLGRYGRSQLPDAPGGPSPRRDRTTGELVARSYEGEDRDLVRGRRNDLGHAEKTSLLAEIAVTRRLLGAAAAALLIVDRSSTVDLGRLQRELGRTPSISPEAARAILAFLHSRRAADDR